MEVVFRPPRGVVDFDCWSAVSRCPSFRGSAVVHRRRRRGRRAVSTFVRRPPPLRHRRGSVSRMIQRRPARCCRLRRSCDALSVARLREVVGTGLFWQRWNSSHCCGHCGVVVVRMQGVVIVVVAEPAVVGYYYGAVVNVVRIGRPIVGNSDCDDDDWHFVHYRYYYYCCYCACDRTAASDRLLVVQHHRTCESCCCRCRSHIGGGRNARGAIRIDSGFVGDGPRNKGGDG